MIIVCHPAEWKSKMAEELKLIIKNPLYRFIAESRPGGHKTKSFQDQSFTPLQSGVHFVASIERIAR